MDVDLLHMSQIRVTSNNSTWVKSEQHPSTPHESNQSNIHLLHMSQIIATSIYSTWVKSEQQPSTPHELNRVYGCYSDLTHVEWMDVTLIWLMWRGWMLLWFDSCEVDGCSTSNYSTWVKSEQQPSTPHELNQSNIHLLHMSQIRVTSIHSTWVNSE
jgi:hypothetical protein